MAVAIIKSSIATRVIQAQCPDLVQDPKYNPTWYSTGVLPVVQCVIASSGWSPVLSFAVRAHRILQWHGAFILSASSSVPLRLFL